MANTMVLRVSGLLGLSVGLLAACGGQATGSRAEGGTGSAPDGVAGASAGTAPDGVAGASGGTAPDGAAGAPAGTAGTTLGTGPLDTTGLPTTFPPLLCDGPLGALQLQLPCKVGNSLSGVNVVECYDTRGRTAFAFYVTLANAAASIGQAVPVMAPTLYDQIDVAGTRYFGKLSGSLVFSQVDGESRGFVAQLTDGKIAWTSPGQPEVDCELDTTPLWATAGDFF